MYFKRVYDEGLAQASYIIGCQQEGTAVVVDPRRDTQVYINLANENNLRIVAVTETHIHADYLSGSEELGSRTGAELYLSDEGGDDWRYSLPHQGLKHGSEIKFGNITLRALHTPGHTPEHLSFLVTDGARSNMPVMLLTGDFVFVGDLGRPDLLDEAAGGTDSRFVGARQLATSLIEVFEPLPDYVQVWPGHGSGSACGKALGAVESTTVGYERAFAWWATSLHQKDVEGFTQELLEGQPDVPIYFGRMKRLNKESPALVPVEPLRQLEPADLSGKLLVDTRSREMYQRRFLPDSVNLAPTKTFETWAGWLIDPETEARPLVLLASDGVQAQALRERLWRVGIDNVVGYVTSFGTLPTETAIPLSPQEVDALSDKFVLDVRTRAEYDAGHIPGATLIHAGKLPRQLDVLPREQPIVVHCQSGMRSVAAASLLRANGFERVFELAGGYPNWKRAQSQKPVQVA